MKNKSNPILVAILFAVGFIGWQLIKGGVEFVDVAVGILLAIIVGMGVYIIQNKKLAQRK